MPKVYIENVDPDLIFEWFYHAVVSDCGDGGAVICCGNLEEAYSFFIDWAKLNQKYTHLKMDRYEFHSVNFISNHDSNENFTFANKEVEMPFGEISFIIKEDCQNQLTSKIDGYTLRKV